MASWNISRAFGIFYNHWVQSVFIWNIFSGFGIMYQGKSGNPGIELKAALSFATVQTKNVFVYILVIANLPIAVFFFYTRISDTIPLSFYYK
jgi:hypothetical protein